ncbi:MAG TPA: glutathione S-transferase family protein [Deltaproteobacteria bacterium]|nr:glutathione S-transferase family protein [Candidatus Binatota bacterium]HIL12923.1 glutathione S-transferase family protein [Deltaproteobacteria bacterium]
MIKLWYAPLTRSIRVLWLLEELAVPYELERVEFEVPSSRFFAQDTPTGKLPTIEDGGLVLCESGAIVEYLVERYGEGRLAPPPGTPERGHYLQWIHMAESTVFPPVGILVWLSRYRTDGDEYAALQESTRARAEAGVQFVENELSSRQYLLGDDFSAADVMMGFSLVAARFVDVIDDRYPAVQAYLSRLEQRPAYREAVKIGGG